MLIKAIRLAFLVMLCATCQPFFPGPRNINWENEWKKNNAKLKALVHDIKMDANSRYHIGNNDYPQEFKYPFDEGFYINRLHSGGDQERIDMNNLTVIFYVDRGLLDHYSAFIYSNDSISIKALDAHVENGGNDLLIEPNWYMIND